MIKDVIFTKGFSAFFFDDQRAIKQGAKHDGFIYEGKPVSQGFRTIRKAGECISIQLLLEGGQVAIGDCAAVQYSGAGGRDPLFLSDIYIPFLEKHIKPKLLGLELAGFKQNVAQFESLEIEGKKLHTAIRYGLSQALLDAQSKASGKMKCEVLCEEYNLSIESHAIPIFGQTGDDRYLNADKMILKEVDVMPHALINNINEKLGKSGEKLQEYIAWLASRVKKLKHNHNYNPVFHIDVYGTIGEIYNNDLEKVSDYIASLEKYAQNHELYIEGPVDFEEKNKEIDALAEIKNKLNRLGSNVKIVADEWCNTFEDIKDFCDAKACHMVQIKTPDLGGIQNIIESILYCKTHNMESYQGGTCNETDISAKTCVHVACAARPERILAKPGMGFDEGFSIVKNEMARINGILKAKGY